MPIAVELRTTCENCKDPLPVNLFATKIPCWSCLHENPLSPEHWSQLLGSALENAWAQDEGEGTTENLNIGRRRFELRWAPGQRPKGTIRPRSKEMRAELFPGVVGSLDEEPEGPAARENIAFQCTQCGGALSIDGRSREVDCTYCKATTQLSDVAWRRIHPLHAQKRWWLVLEDDGEKVAPAAREAPTAPPFRVLDLTTGPAQFSRSAASVAGSSAASAPDVASDPTKRGDGGLEPAGPPGPDGLLYALVEYEKGALVCMDSDLTVRWRTDLKGRTDLMDRVAVVGDEVWLVDADKHALRRFARADGKLLGKLGTTEPDGAKVHELDVKGSSDIVGCPDGTVLVLVAHRLVRYDKHGKGILTWPALGCIWGLIAGERLRPLYKGPLYEPDLEDVPGVHRPTTAEYQGEITSDLAKSRPLWVVTIQTRAATAADGSLWLYDGKQVVRYARDGTRQWGVEVEGEGGLTVRPALDGELNCYVVAMDKRQRCVLYRISPDGKLTRLTDDGLGYVIALAVTPEGRITVFGSNAGDVRVFDRDGKRLRASAAAVESDRYAAEDQEDEDEDDDD